VYDLLTTGSDDITSQSDQDTNYCDDDGLGQIGDGEDHTGDVTHDLNKEESQHNSAAFGEGEKEKPQQQEPSRNHTFTKRVFIPDLSVIADKDEQETEGNTEQVGEANIE